MISVVCVYNSRDILDSYLLKCISKHEQPIMN